MKRQQLEGIGSGNRMGTLPAAMDQKRQDIGCVGVGKPGFVYKGKKAFKRIVVIFKTTVTDTGVFQVQEPLKQVIGLCRCGIDVKNGFGVLTKGFDPDGVGFDGRGGKGVDFFKLGAVLIDQSNHGASIWIKGCCFM